MWLFGRAWLEALVLAILLGTAIRTAWTPDARWRVGVTFCAKTLLEVAVVLLGASISVQTIEAIGGDLLVGIAVVVVVAIGASYTIGRALGLPRRMAVLVACGNSICGNSAIAAVAPVIGADSKDVASSIAFTAVLGVVVVLTLPLTHPADPSEPGAIWRAGRADGLCRAAGTGRARPHRPAGGADRHGGQAGAGC